MKYGKYSVGCSSVWEGTCNVCGEYKPVTETRDYGYLSKGISEVRAEIAAIKELKSQKPIMTDEELDEVLAPYESGEITLKLTEEEVAFLNECLDTIQEWHSTLQPDKGGYTVPEDVPLFESIEKKITALYEDNCVKYSLTPAMAAFIEKYNEIPPEGDTRWEIFRDAYNMALEAGK
jgi:hypothetical protein